MITTNWFRFIDESNELYVAQNVTKKRKERIIHSLSCSNVLNVDGEFLIERAFNLPRVKWMQSFVECQCISFKYGWHFVHDSHWILHFHNSVLLHYHTAACDRIRWKFIVDTKCTHFVERSATENSKTLTHTIFILVIKHKNAFHFQCSTEEEK